VSSSLDLQAGNKLAVTQTSGYSALSGTLRPPSVSTTVSSHFIIAAPTTQTSSTPSLIRYPVHRQKALQSPSFNTINVHNPLRTLPSRLPLSNSTAIISHLSLEYNFPPAPDFGISLSSVFPLLDSSPQRAHQTIGLVGRIDFAEAEGYRFLTPQLRFRLMEMAGPDAPVMRRIGDVMQLYVGVSEKGAIRVFNHTRDAGGGAKGGKRTADRGHRDLVEEEEEDENGDQGAPAEVANGEHVMAQNGTVLPTVTAIAISCTFDTQTVDQAYTLATKAGCLDDKQATLLFVTAQPR